MGAMASQITGILIFCSTVCSGACQSKHQSSAPLAFVSGIHQCPHKGPETLKMFPFDDATMWNKANLRDLIAATGLVILLKLDSNCQFFSPCDLEIGGWPRKTIGHLFHATSSFLHHFVAIGEFRLELQSGNDQFGSKLTIFFSRVTLKFDWWPWKKIRHLS